MVRPSWFAMMAGLVGEQKTYPLSSPRSFRPSRLALNVLSRVRMRVPSSVEAIRSAPTMANSSQPSGWQRPRTTSGRL